MVFAHKQTPVMSIGRRETAEDAVRAGLKMILFSVRPEEDATAIDAYLKSLAPIPSPRLVKGNLNPAAQRGKQLFADTGCAVCHPAPLFTDNKSHDLHTGTGVDKGKPFVTTRLVEVWRTAPICMMAAPLTVQDAIIRHSNQAVELNRRDLDDLAEFVLSH